MPRGRSGGAPSRAQRNAFRAQNRSRGRERHPAGRARRAPPGGAREHPERPRGPGTRSGTEAPGPGHCRANPAISAPAATAVARATSADTSATADPRGGLAGVVRFLVFLVVLAAVVLVVMVTVARPLLRAVVVPWAWDNPAVMDVGFVADLVREDLGAALSARRDGRDRDGVHGRVRATPRRRSRPSSREAGIIANERAFLFQARVDGLAPKLTAGRFALAGNLTPGEVVEGLVNNRIVTQSIPVTFREGLRLEQIVGQARRRVDRHRRRPEDLLQPRHEAARRAARRLPVAARRDRPPEGRVARGLPVPGDLHAPGRRRGPDHRRGPRPDDARRVHRPRRRGPARRPGRSAA